MAKRKDRTHRLGRVPEEVYSAFKTKADENVSDATLFSDLLSHLAGMPTLAERLSIDEVVALIDPDVLQKFADAAEAHRNASAEQPEQAGQTELIPQTELAIVDANKDKMLAKAS